MVNVPIEGCAHGQAMAADGSFDSTVAYMNRQWELDEVELRLDQVSFCGHEMRAYQAGSVTG